MNARLALIDRGFGPALLALLAQLLFGAIALQPSLATMAASPFCVHESHGGSGSPAHSPLPATAVSPLLVALAIPSAAHAAPPVLLAPRPEITIVPVAIPQGTVIPGRMAHAHRARGPPHFT